MIVITNLINAFMGIIFLSYENDHNQTLTMEYMENLLP